MKFYDEEKILKMKNVLIVVTLLFLSILLFFKVYDYFKKPINLAISTIFPFILSFIIVYSLMPIIDMISNKKNEKKAAKKLIKNRNLAILLVLSIFFAIFIYIVLAFIPLIAKQVSSLIEFFLKNQGNFQKKAFSFMEANNIDLKNAIINSKDVIINITVQLLTSSYSIVSSTFTLLFMTPIFTIMLIFSYDNIEIWIEKFLSEIDSEGKLVDLAKKIDQTIGKYILVTVLDSMIVGIASFIIFYCLKLDYSVLFSIIIGFGNVIPFLGPFIGLIPVIFFAATKSFNLVIVIVVIVTIVQTIEANIVKPWLTGKSVKMHPITTLLVVLIGGALFGIGGAFIGIPIYIVIKLSWIFYWENYLKKEIKNDLKN
ncbi:AI-2E family transporter [Leptotrichia sp. oral taxon 847]|uniref:AI-2E family transporter n=1 Tax=Leptotrichia sp. oral taxon 847 TaxID=1785996 RepID=UPI00076814A6|nr:AI-2E family transporter [Leptotrichia sp. oral taxon 847]AMD95013.1 hypothetical protein AXF11_05065 [Leptotrichia sp. oral taxon 847]